MGYTHYFELKKEITDEVVDDIKRLLEGYSFITNELDSQEEPIITKELIKFNGYGDAGYETFYLKKGCSGYCKTNNREYDLPVCEVLVILRHHYKEDFELTSDGFWVSEVEYKNNEKSGNWDKAIENIRDEFGYEIEFEKVNEGKYYGYRVL